MLPSPALLPPVHILFSSHCQASSLYVVLPCIPCSLWLSQNVLKIFLELGAGIELSSGHSLTACIFFYFVSFISIITYFAS